MAEIQRGSAVVWGISTSSATYTGVGTSRQHFQSQTFSYEADMEETRAGNGTTASVVHYNRSKNVTISVVPSATTLALAISANIVPEPGQDVTVTDTDTVIGGGGIAYMCVSASMHKSNTGKTTIEMTLKRWDSIGTYTPVP
jgi:hypothetical protein